LPPSIVLEVLRIIKEEVDLRELTRVAEQARGALAAHVYEAETSALEETQRGLAERTQQVIRDLEDLQELNDKNYGREIEQLSVAGAAMRDAEELLAIPDTGAPAVAAETEAIEALLRTRKVKPGGGGGGGGSTPGGGGGGEQTDLLASALQRIGRGEASDERPVKQSTGSSLSDVPDEFRRGLDAYFNALEDGGRR